MRLVVLWEDQLARGNQPNNFAPHLLALQCVLDERPHLARNARVLQLRAEAHPTRGVDKLLSKAQHMVQRPLLAVPDNDRVREHLGLESATTDEQVLAALRSRCPSAHFVLLERNLDDAVRHAAIVLSREVPPGKPSPEQRDRVLQQLISATPLERGHFLDRMPSFRKVVEKLAELLEHA